MALENIIEKYSFENNISPILWLDSKGKVISHNGMLDFYIKEDKKGKYIYRLLTDVSDEDWNSLWEKIKEKYDYSFDYKFYNKIIDKVQVLKISAKLVPIDNQEYCFLIITDITELIESNHRLEREKARVIESERLKDAFLANMSHEVRTPMNAIVGFSEILHEYVDETLREYTSIINENVEYLLSLIDNVITISKIDSNQMKSFPTIVDISSLVNELVIKYNIKIKKIEKKLTISFDGFDHFEMETDSYLLELALDKLIENSVKFSNEGEIRVGFERKNDKIIFFVADKGIGIQNKYHEIIFDRFRQIDKHVVGSGLGLAIFKESVSLMGGEYEISSIYGKGTVVSFSLSNETEYVKEKQSNLAGKKILVAEDLEVNQTMIREMLHPLGAVIIKSMNGKECIEKFIEIGDIDLVLMDLDMPLVDGYDATILIREKDKIVPIIVQSAYTQKENRERAKKIGINDFITKPIRKEDLVRIILKHI